MLQSHIELRREVGTSELGAKDRGGKVHERDVFEVGIEGTKRARFRHCSHGWLFGEAAAGAKGGSGTARAASQLTLRTFIRKKVGVFRIGLEMTHGGRLGVYGGIDRSWLIQC